MSGVTEQRYSLEGLKAPIIIILCSSYCLVMAQPWVRDGCLPPGSRECNSLESFIYRPSWRILEITGCGPPQETPAWQMGGQICFDISRNEELTFLKQLRTTVRKPSLCLADICLLVPSVLPSKAPHILFTSVQEALTLHPWMPDRAIWQLELSCPFVQHP